MDSKPGDPLSNDSSRGSEAPSVNQPVSGLAGSSLSFSLELAYLLVFFLSGCVIRWYQTNQLAIEHFDEGVYACEFFYADLGGFPNRHLYAPPLWPNVLRECCTWNPDLRFAPFLPNLVVGSLLPILVWWCGRSLFNPITGLIAAGTIAFHDTTILYSRTALTDIWLTAGLVFSMTCLYRAAHQLSWKWGLAASLGIAFSWWTKYNGWLPLALAFPAFVIQKRWGLGFALWLAIALVACALWSPCLWMLQEKGGYAAVAANHRQYLSGFAGWVPSLHTQFQNCGIQEGWLSRLGMGAALVIGSLSMGGFPRSLILALIPLIIGPTASGLLIFLTGMGYSLSAQPKNQLGTSTILILSWCAGLLFLIPCYRPYPRLMLPLIAGISIGAGWAISYLQRDRRIGPHNLVPTSAVAIILALMLKMLPTATTPFAPGLSPRNDSLRATEYLVRHTTKLAPHPNLIWHVYGEPAVCYHLQYLGWPLVEPTSHLKFIDEIDREKKHALVFGRHALSDPNFVEKFNARRGRLLFNGRDWFRPSLASALDFEGDNQAAWELQSWKIPEE